ncbi:MAG: DUF983 domain-containing protein [Bacteroidota bacterium]
MKTLSLLTNAFAQKCPRCRQEKVFTHRAYDLRRFDQMHNYCPNCGQSFDPEPGFFTGAMYVSYGFQIGLAIATVLAIQIFWSAAPIWVYIVSITTLVLLLFPVIFRLSRSFWLHIFIPHDASYATPPLSLEEQAAGNKVVSD